MRLKYPKSAPAPRLKAVGLPEVPFDDRKIKRCALLSERSTSFFRKDNSATGSPPVQVLRPDWSRRLSRKAQAKPLPAFPAVSPAFVTGFLLHRICVRRDMRSSVQRRHCISRCKAHSEKSAFGNLKTSEKHLKKSEVAGRARSGETALHRVFRGCIKIREHYRRVCGRAGRRDLQKLYRNTGAKGLPAHFSERTS